MKQESLFYYLNEYSLKCLGVDNLFLPQNESIQCELINNLLKESNKYFDEKKVYRNDQINSDDQIISPNQLQQMESKSNKAKIEISESDKIRWESGEVFPSPLDLELFLNSKLSELKKEFFSVVFIRVIDEEKQKKSYLVEFPRALEIFQKLRKALDLNSEFAPCIELYKSKLEISLKILRSKSKKIIIMHLDEIIKGNAEGRPEWSIPDPVVLESNSLLKRPTWEMLKEWKDLSKLDRVCSEMPEIE